MKRYYEEGMAYFVTTVTDKRSRIFQDRKMCRVLLITLEYYKTIFDYQVFGYCLMPDHLHLIVRPSPRFDLSMIMKMIKGSFTRKINKLSDINGSSWQQSFYEEAVRSRAQLLTQLEYMHLNPVKASLAVSPEEFEYSSYRQYFHPENPGEVLLEVDKEF